MLGKIAAPAPIRHVNGSRAKRLKFDGIRAGFLGRINERACAFPVGRGGAHLPIGSSFGDDEHRPFFIFLAWHPHPHPCEPNFWLCCKPSRPYLRFWETKPL